MKKLVFAFIFSLLMLGCNTGVTKQEVPSQDSIELADTTFVGDSVIADIL